MKKNILILLISCYFLGVNQKAFAQNLPTVARDFKMDDCNGQMHHLFSELDSGNVVIMEFFMLSCRPCIDAGHALDAMILPLKKSYGNKVRFYQLGFTPSYTCTKIKDWISTNGFANSVPFDSGDVQVAYYGGMGMPTVVIVGGKDHKILHNTQAFELKDTTVMSKTIHDFFAGTLGISKMTTNNSAISVFPNPATNNLTVSMNAEKSGMLSLTLMNIQGQEIMKLYHENVNAGAFSKSIPLPNIANGIYFIRGEMNQQNFTQKITVLNQ
ncbi:MAG: T9SS type A sorting domain-containing protein [Bacteroidia bacterium]